MAVAKDAIGTVLVSNENASTSFNYTGLTVVSNTNGAILLIIVCANKTSDTIGSVTGYTFINAANTSDGTWRVELWGKVGNSTGAQTIAITPSSGWTNGDAVIITALSVTGANQTGGSTTFANATTNTGTSANGTISITTTASDLAAAMIAINNEANGVTHTTLFIDTTTTPTVVSGYDQNDATSPAVIATTGGATSVVWAAAGVNIKAVATGDTLGGAMQLMFV